MDLGAVAVLIGAVLGASGLGAILQARALNRRTTAQANSIDADAQVTLGGGWQVLVGEQRVELNEMRERIAVVEQRAVACELREAGYLDRISALERREIRGADFVIDLIDKEIERRERTHG